MAFRSSATSPLAELRPERDDLRDLRDAMESYGKLWDAFRSPKFRHVASCCILGYLRSADQPTVSNTFEANFPN